MFKRLLILFLFFIYSCARQFSPTAEYVVQNKGKWTMEIPEVQELVHIIIAITPTGISDSNMVYHGTEYYRSVKEHFGKNKDHQAVKSMEALLKKGFYTQVKMDACGYYFSEHTKISKDKTYKQLNWSNRNFIQPYIKELEDFAGKTGFRQFFSDNRRFYDSLIELARVQMPIDQQWQWLEKNFPDKYDNYRITFSPLVYGSHSTNRFLTKGFRQTVMFISGPLKFRQQVSDKVREGLMTRMIFTEIDHNYVNPVSDKYLKEINETFNDLDKWTSGSDSKNYGGPYPVFNEYMTWAVFTLYALDTFNEADFRIINERVEYQMVKLRGFSRFKEFNRKMIDLYKSRRSWEKVADLYPRILEWCRVS